MDPVAKKLLNSLRCPICQSPIDTASGYFINYNYGCASNIDHYAIHLILWDPIIKIDRERVNFYDENRKYSIIKSYIDSDVVTEMEVYETDLEHRTIFSFKEKKLVMNMDLFDFTNFNKDKAINRIRTIFVFQ